MRSSRGLSMCMLLMVALIPVIAVARLAGAQTPSASTGQQVLHRGDRGEAVARLQRMLTEAGFNPGPVDGIYGPLTEGAVRAAQTGLGLQVDGLAGPLTSARLQVAAAAGGQPATAETPPATSGPATVDPAASEVPEKEPAAPVVGAPHLFALTFNGDPDPDLLPQILATLKKYGMQATFFLHGEAAERSPALAASVVTGGHEIASGGYTARDMTQLSQVVTSADLYRAAKAIEKVTGKSPAFFRPQDGKFNAGLLQAVSEQNLKLALWTNVGLTDWPGIDPQDLAQGLAKTVTSGAILMLHQDRPTSVEGLEPLLQALRSSGYQSVTLSRLMAP